MPYLGTPPASELANLDINGQSLILDADADTHITADTDDQIDIHIAGADDFQFTANTFTALSGSAITLADGQLGTTQGTNSVPCPSIDKFKYAYSVGDESGSNLIAHAYAKLKTESVLDGASDV